MMGGVLRHSSPLWQKIEALHQDEIDRQRRAEQHRKDQQRLRLLELSERVSKAKEQARGAQGTTDNEEGSKPDRETARAILAEVAERHGVTVIDVIGPGRFKKIVAARYEAIGIIAATHWHWSLPQLGRFFGGRDHTTIIHAICKRVIETDTPLRGWSVMDADARVRRIRTNIRPAVVRYERGKWTTEARA
jgi:hypothetical protein